MNAKKETEYLNKHWKKMRDGVKAFLQTNDPEALHGLRVEVKKLRAMLTLMQTVMHNKKLLKRFKPVRQVFKHAGEIRNAQVNLKLAKEYNLHNPDFEAVQQQAIEQGSREFKSKGRKYLKKIKRAHHRIKSTLRKVPDKSIANFYNKQLKQIAQSLAIPHFDEGLHDCRKQLKVLMYNHTLTEKALQHRVEFNGQYIDELQNSIGEWHDHALALDLFASSEVKAMPAVSKIKRQNRKTEQCITDMSRDFLTKATTAAEKTNEAKHEH